MNLGKDIDLLMKAMSRKDYTAYIIHNHRCTKCDCVEKEMVRIQHLILCNKCFEEEIGSCKTKAGIAQVYLKWINVQKEKALKVLREEEDK